MGHIFLHRTKHFFVTFLFIFLLSCCHNSRTGSASSAITAETAYEGVSNYCHSEYDWSIAEENPGIMSLEMGEGTESDYLVVFRSYTGSLTYFYVDKQSGSTRMVEYVPALDIRSEAGTINLFDYLGKQ